MARKKQSLLNSAAILIFSMVVVKVIGVIYKIPITNDIKLDGFGYFDAAYNVYIPIYSIALGGLPVAISKMVSHYVTLGRYRDVRRVKKVASMLFFITGTLGTLALLAIAYPYTSMDWRISVNTPELLPSLILIAPSVFFCCMMSAYRGYYNGLRNMFPTAISEIVEALGKAVFGIVLVKIVLNKGYADFAAGKAVFGQMVASKQEAFTVICPYAAAAAILGVTIGTLLAYAFLAARHRFSGDGITIFELRASPKPDSPSKISKNLILIAVPIVTSSLIFNLTSFIDSWTVLNRLGSVVEGNMGLIRDMYAEAFEVYYVPDERVMGYLYGAYAVSLNFKNLLPTLTVTLGTSAIPVIAEAWALKDRGTVKRSVETVIRLTMLIALPAGIGMGVLSRQLLTLLYNDPETLSGLMISASCLTVYGFAAFLIAGAQPLTSMLQGLGHSNVPIVSTAVGAGLKILVNYIMIGIPRVNVYGAVVGSVVCYASIVMINYVSIVKITGVKPDMSRIFIKPLICAVLCGVAAFASNGLLSRFIPVGDTTTRLNGATLSTLLAVLIAAFVYVISLFLLNAITKSDIRMLPKGEKIAKILEKYGILG